MQRDPRAYLWDVREAALAIETFIAGLDEASFEASPMALAAVERKFEVIGEALNQLSKVDAGLAARVPDLPKIVAFRNQLIHGYASIEPRTVWNIAQGALPKLATTVQGLLDELQSQ